MIRSLFGGVSGLRNHQTLMDVIGNNIANVNTVGFKAGRVTFKESLALMLRGAQSATDQRGGINPMQIGLGMAVGSVDADFSQGNLENTGQVTDLAIQGDGFYVVNDGNRNFYTRAGNFKLDANGRLVSPNNGFVLQGLMATAGGDIPEGATIGDIVLPFGTKIPAKATSVVNLSGNLDAGGLALGTILETDSVYAVEDGIHDIEGLLRRNASNGDYSTITGMAPNSTTVTIDDGQGNMIVYTYVDQDIGVGDDLFHTLEDLLDEIDNDFGSGGTDSLRANINSDTGQISFTSGSTLSLRETSGHTKTNGGAIVSATSLLDNGSGNVLDTTGGGNDISDGETIEFYGTLADGTAVGSSGIPLVFEIDSNSATSGAEDYSGGTVEDLLTAIESEFQGAGGTDVNITLDESTGRIVVEDANTGESQMELHLNYTGAGSLDFGEFDFQGTELNITSTNTDLAIALGYANGNLAGGAETDSQEFSHVATQDDELTRLRTQQGLNLRVNTGDIITVNGSKGGDSVDEEQFVVGTDVLSYGDFVDSVEQVFAINNSQGLSIDEDGSLMINGDGGTLNEIAAVDIVVNEQYFSDRRLVDSNGDAISGGQSPAANSAVATTWDSVSGSVTDGDTIKLSGKTHDGTLVNATYTISDASTDTVGSLLDSIESTFGNVDAYLSDGTDGNRDGMLVVKDLTGGQSQLTVDLTANNEGGGSLDFGSMASSTWNNIFDSTTGNYFERQTAEDYTQNASITVYDSKGESHVLNFTFTKNPVEVNKWTWSAGIGTDDATVISGGSGVLTFDSEGNLSTFTYDGGFQSLRFTPGNGAGIVDLDVDPGSFSTINGLSQFAGSANAIVKSQDGYTSGDLSDITIDDAGKITGFFSNGISQNLAQISLATFNNPNGLVRRGDNLYEVSGNSGQPVIGEAGKTIQSKIASGNLEQSNVELAEEFTKMIVAQRGFQANARVLTVSDQLLQEVVGLKR